MSQPSPIKSFQRASKGKPKYPPPFSMRLTWEERAYLGHVCGSMPWSAYIRKTVLADMETPRKRARRHPKVDETALSRALGALGQSRLASNLNQIAKAANQGALPVTPELMDELNAACAEVRALRADIIAALGLKVEE